MGDAYVDPTYKEGREDAFIGVVVCGQAGGTCFCALMNTGLNATVSYDLGLTEILEPERHFFQHDPVKEPTIQCLAVS